MPRANTAGDSYQKMMVVCIINAVIFITILAFYEIIKEMLSSWYDRKDRDECRKNVLTFLIFCAVLAIVIPALYPFYVAG